MPHAHLLVDTTPAGVRTLTLDRPERLNAVNPALADALPRAVDEAAADDAVRVVVITGAGRGFCAPSASTRWRGWGAGCWRCGGARSR